MGHLEPEIGGAGGVPCIGRDEADLAGRDAHAIDGELIDASVRLVDPDILDGQDGIELGGEPFSKHSFWKLFPKGCLDHRSKLI